MQLCRHCGDTPQPVRDLNNPVPRDCTASTASVCYIKPHGMRRTGGA